MTNVVVLKSSLPGGLEPDITPTLTSEKPPQRGILFVEPDTAVLSANAVLLTNADYRVATAFNDSEILALHDINTIALAILSASLGGLGLRASAEAVRRRWPRAQILILSPSAFGLDDYLYDERLDPCPAPKRLLDTLERLCTKPWNQSTNTADLYLWHLGASVFRSSIQESDPTKAPRSEIATMKSARAMQSDVQSRRLKRA